MRRPLSRIADMVRDGPSTSADGPEVVRIEDLERLGKCTASWPLPGPTLRVPNDRRDAESPALRRWKHMRDAIVSWHQAERQEDGTRRAREFLAVLDAVELDECER